MRVTLSQKKASMAYEAADIEKLMERGHATPEKRARYAEIEKFFADLSLVEKPKKSNQTEEAI